MCMFDVKAAGTVTDGDMVGREDSTGGAWTAYGYGTAAKNPSGIVLALSTPPLTMAGLRVHAALRQNDPPRLPNLTTCPGLSWAGVFI